MSNPPQRPRWLRRLAATQAPLIQLWGWPGSGRGALLAALAAEGDAWVPPGADLARPDALARFLASGARWLVSTSWPDSAQELASRVASLPLGRTLVLPTVHRWQLAEPLGDVLGPHELALTAVEARELWRQERGEELDDGELGQLLATTDGWYEPVRLAARGAGVPRSLSELLSRPEIGEFLEARVLGERRPVERRTILAAQGERLATSGWPFLTQPEARWPAPLAGWCRRRAGGARATARRSARVELRLLGPIEARVRSAPDDPWRPGHWPLKKAFRTLAFLATSPAGSATREELIEAVFPRADEGWLARNFHPTLSHLRRGLGLDDGVSPVELRDGRYGLVRDIDWWSDVEEHAAQAQGGREAAAEGRDEDAVVAWRTAWALYRGPLFQGWYEPWAEERRIQASRIQRQVLRDLGSALLRLERDDEALDAFRAALVEDPLEERLHVEVLRLYGRLGRRDLVRRQYERLSTQLREELGVEPLAATTEVYHRLMVERS